jgi:hypothetical protein
MGFFFINKCTLLTYGFVPDIMIILQKYKLVEYIDNFSKTSLFPSQKIWDSNVTVKRKIKIFEESKIDERFNFWQIGQKVTGQKVTICTVHFIFLIYLTFTDYYMIYTTANSVWCFIQFIHKYQSQLYHYLS